MILNPTTVIVIAYLVAAIAYGCYCAIECGAPDRWARQREEIIRWNSIGNDSVLYDIDEYANTVEPEPVGSLIAADIVLFGLFGILGLPFAVLIWCIESVIRVGVDVTSR